MDSAVHGKHGKENSLVEQWASSLLTEEEEEERVKHKMSTLTSIKQGHSRASYGEWEKHKMSSKATPANNYKREHI